MKEGAEGAGGQGRCSGAQRETPCLWREHGSGVVSVGEVEGRWAGRQVARERGSVGGRWGVWPGEVRWGVEEGALRQAGSGLVSMGEVKGRWAGRRAGGCQQVSR